MSPLPSEDEFGSGLECLGKIQPRNAQCYGSNPRLRQMVKVGSARFMV
jgi:hypothetical protein